MDGGWNFEILLVTYLVEMYPNTASPVLVEICTHATEVSLSVASASIVSKYIGRIQEGI